MMVPAAFEEQYVRVYTRRRAVARLARIAFELWCDEERADRGRPLPWPGSAERPARTASATTATATTSTTEADGSRAGAQSEGSSSSKRMKL